MPPWSSSWDGTTPALIDGPRLLPSVRSASGAKSIIMMAFFDDANQHDDPHERIKIQFLMKQSQGQQRAPADGGQKEWWG